MRKAAIIALIAVLLFVSGCAQLPGLPKAKGPSIITTTQSIVTDVKNPLPDAEVSSSHEFAPVVEVANMGNADAEGVVCISGLDDRTFRGFSGCECQDFKVYAEEKDGDTSQEIEFGPYKAAIEEPQDALMTTTTRYSYKTTGIAKACIKKDIYGKTGCQTEDIAKNKRNMLVKSTSGAVIINKVKETIIPLDKQTVTLIFNVEVEKDRKGDVYDLSRSNYPSCRAEEKQDRGIIGKIEGLPEGSVKCSEAELDEKGEGTLTCEAENIRLFDPRGNFLFPGDNYEPEITIELDYGYEQRQSVKFKVAKGIQ